MALKDGVVTPAMLIYASFVLRVFKSCIYQTSSLSPTQYCILLELQRAPGSRGPTFLQNRSGRGTSPMQDDGGRTVFPSVGIGQIAQKLALTPSAISIALRELEKYRLITCTSNEDDRRGIILAITRAGNREIERIDTALAEAIASVWQPLTAKQRRMMLSCSLKAMSNHERLRIDGGHLRADTAYAEGMIMSYNAYQKAARLHRVSINEAIVLYWLSSQQQPRATSEVCRAVLLKLNYVTQVSQKLVERGLIKREVDSQDRRIALLKATQEGRERIQHIRKDLDRVVLSGFFQPSLAEQDCFRDVAEAIIGDEIKRSRFVW